MYRVKDGISPVSFPVVLLVHSKYLFNIQYAGIIILDYVIFIIVNIIFIFIFFYIACFTLVDICNLIPKINIEWTFYLYDLSSNIFFILSRVIIVITYYYYYFFKEFSLLYQYFFVTVL